MKLVDCSDWKIKIFEFISTKFINKESRNFILESNKFEINQNKESNLQHFRRKSRVGRFIGRLATPVALQTAHFTMHTLIVAD